MDNFIKVYSCLLMEFLFMIKELIVVFLTDVQCMLSTENTN